MTAKSCGRGALLGIISFFIGFAVGGMQFFLTHRLIKKLLAKDSAYLFFFVMLKVVIWVGFFVAAAFLMRDYIIPAGSGAAAALIAGGAIGFVIQMRKDKKEK